VAYLQCWASCAQGARAIDAARLAKRAATLLALELAFVKQGIYLAEHRRQACDKSFKQCAEIADDNCDVVT